MSLNDRGLDLIFSEKSSSLIIEISPIADLQRIEYKGSPPDPSSLTVKRASSPKIYPGPRRRKVASEALG